MNDKNNKYISLYENTKILSFKKKYNTKINTLFCNNYLYFYF